MINVVSCYGWIYHTEFPRVKIAYVVASVLYWQTYTMMYVGICMEDWCDG
jgi:hypothetical protein